MGATRGFAGLLNVGTQRHWTVFVSDFALDRSDVRRVQQQTAELPTRVLFARADGLRSALEKAAVDVTQDYVSLQVIARRFDSLHRVREVFLSLRHADLAQIDVPRHGVRFKRDFATHALDVVMDADYDQQDRISDRFFHHLERRVPYRVVIQTGERSELVVCDDTAWFHLAGRMREGESRALPGGEVAYTGERIDGEFTADGALLPSPEEPRAGRTAARLNALSRRICREPLRVRINHGGIVELEGAPQVLVPLRHLLERDPRYREVTEVGISFNGACRKFIYDWPAPSNEGRPGVHIGIGGDPDRRHVRSKNVVPLVHIDLMAASTAVWVNEATFLKTL